MIVKESIIFEFERGDGNTLKNMGIGQISKRKEKFEKFSNSSTMEELITKRGFTPEEVKLFASLNSEDYARAKYYFAKKTKKAEDLEKFYKETSVSDLLRVWQVIYLEFRKFDDVEKTKKIMRDIILQFILHAKSMNKEIGYTEQILNYFTKEELVKRFPDVEEFKHYRDDKIKLPDKSAKELEEDYYIAEIMLQEINYGKITTTEQQRKNGTIQFTTPAGTNYFIMKSGYIRKWVPGNDRLAVLFYDRTNTMSYEDLAKAIIAFIKKGKLKGQ